MTSRHWKDLREKDAFLQQLREFRDATVLSADLPIDDEWYFDAVYDDPYDDWYDEDTDEEYGLDDYDPWYEDDWDSYPRFHSGNHIRVNGVVYLALDDGRYANILTGAVNYILPDGEKELL